jgi:hypothetical protein
MGVPEARSPLISAPTVTWSFVRLNGRAASKPSSSAPACRAVEATARSFSRCCSRAACSTKASWKRSALRAPPHSASVVGRWMLCTARSYDMSLRRERIAAGTGSSSGGSVSRTTAMAFCTCQLVIEALAG